MMNMLEKPKDSLANLENPLILSPIGAPNRGHEHGAGTPFATKLLTGLRGGVSHAPSYLPSILSALNQFFIMAYHNTKIVYQTFGILESSATSSEHEQFHYGQDFHYKEYQEHSSAIVSVLSSCSVLLFNALLAFGPLRSLFKRILPVSGEGPSKNERENGWWKATTVAVEHNGNTQAKVIIKGQGDPGYKSTSMMISECALAVLQNRDQLPELARRGGILTPASALGNVLKERLEKTGFYSFEVSSQE